MFRWMSKSDKGQNLNRAWHWWSQNFYLDNFSSSPAQVAMFLVACVSAHGHRNKNNNNKNNNNKNRGGKREERCGVQQYTVSEKTYKQEVTCSVFRMRSGQLLSNIPVSWGVWDQVRHILWEQVLHCDWGEQNLGLLLVNSPVTASSWSISSCSDWLMCPVQVTTKYEQVCATSYVESCATVTEVRVECPGLWLVACPLTRVLIGQYTQVIRDCHTASLHTVPAYGHGHGHLYGHYTAPVNECVEVMRTL